MACVAPHAGYEYSGAVAAHSYLHVSSLRDPELLVVIAPNHYGIGSGISSCDGGAWQTPLGLMQVDSTDTRRLAEATGIIEFDPVSHRHEHSLEVQLPFLQGLYGNKIPLVPISLAFQDIGTAIEIGKGLKSILEGRKAVLVASSDLTHYEPAEMARKKDLELIERVESLDTEAFYSTLERSGITACGFGAIASVMEAAKLLGFRKGELLKYANSGDTTGDNSQVVGYAAIRFV